MHGVCTTTGSCCFTRYFSSRDNECIICFGNKICVAIVIIMTMTDKDILAFDVLSPSEIALQIAARVKTRRLELNLTQEGMAARAGLKFATYRRFEQTGEISLKGLLQIGFALNVLSEFDVLFAQKQYQSLDDVLKEQSVTRKRGKKNE